MANDRGNITFQFLAEPTDVNFGGKVHGGSVMKWIDQAAFACASNWSSSYCVTVYVGGVRFFKPIRIGNLVKLNAQIIYTGTTSMHIMVDVYSRDYKHESFIKNTHCIIVFVALDEYGNKINVPQWIPNTEEQKSWEKYAITLINLRQNIDDEMWSFINKSE